MVPKMWHVAAVPQGDISSGKLDNRGDAAVGDIRLHEDGDAGHFGVRECGLKIGDLIAGRLAGVWIGQLAIGDEDRHLAEDRFNFDPPIATRGPATSYRRLRRLCTP